MNKKRNDMEVSFVKQGAVYVAEFEVPGDFNLHLERKKGGIISIYQRGSSQGEYDLSYTSFADDVFDHDFGALVYPKWIKVESSSEVVSASVNFNEGGGSGSGSGETSTIEYLDVSGMDVLNSEGKDFSIGIYAFSVKMTMNGEYSAFIPSALFQSYSTYPGSVVVHAVAIDFSFPTSMFGGEILTIKEYLISLGLTQEQLDAIPRITKEQFYNLEA